MKKLLLFGIGGVLLALAGTAQAGTRVSIGVGFGGGYGYYGHHHHHHGYYGRRSCGPYWRGAYYAPSYYYVEPAPVVVAAPVMQTRVVERVVEREPAVESSQPLPYGFVSTPGKVKSPWSDFVISQAGLAPGQVVYDAHNGKAFRIP
jgi:hypothetical protein